MSGKKGVNPRAWSPEEDAIMVKHFRELGSDGLLDMLPRRNKKSIGLRACLLKLTSPREDLWTEEQKAELRANYADKGAKVVSAATGKSVMAVRRKAGELGVRGRLNRPREPQEKPKKLAKPNNFGRIDPTHQALRKSAKKPVALPNQEVDRTPAKSIGKCKPFVDRRWLPDGPVPRVVDPDACRDWAKAAA